MRAPTAWFLAGLTLVFVIGDVVVTAAYRPLLSEAAVAQHGFPFTPLAVLGSALLGAVILSRHERHAVGQLLNLVGVLSAFSLLAEAYHLWVFEEGGPGSATVASVAGWLSSLTAAQVAFAGLAVMFLLAPDGQFLSPRWRWVAGSITVGLIACSLVLASMDPTEFRLRDADTGGVRGPVFTAGFALIGGGLIASLISMWIRLRRSAGVERQQVRLLGLAVAALIAGLANLLIVTAANGGQQTWQASLPLLVAYMLMPVLFTLAALRYRLYDIEVVINRTVVLAVGFTFAAVGYTTVVVVVGRLVHTRTGGLVLSLVATAVVALAFQPLRRVVIKTANRIAYGSRAKPYEALSDFSRRLADSPSAAALLPAVAEAAGRAVAARRSVAALHSVDGRIVSSATWGEERADRATVEHVIPVRSGDHVLGNIGVDVLPTRPLRPADERLLTALAEQAAVAFRNVAWEAQLADHVAELDQSSWQLARSRARIMDADALVRRELEAAISREVLPALVALPDRLRAARLAVQEGAPANGLDVLVSDTNSALESLRELTRGVFPTQLGRVGVEPALRSFLTRTDGAPALQVHESAAGRRFASGVENAVYFCCVEAARAGPATIDLTIEDAGLVVEIGGLTRPATELEPIIDRVGAVGGSLTAAIDGLRLVIPVEARPRVASTPSVSD